MSGAGTDDPEPTWSRPPIPLVALGGVALGFLVVPLGAIVIRAPWGSMLEVLSRPASLDALRLSLITSVSAAALALVLGVPLAWLLARARVPGRPLLRAVVMLPLVLPPVVGGVALLAAFGRRGVVGGPLYDLTGWQIPFTTVAVVLAEAFVALPFLVITVEGALRSADTRLEEAAATLGARPWTIVRRVTLPMIAPALVAGTVLAWARALGEFGATITFAGSLPGVTRTLPLEVYAALDTDRDAALALSVVMLAVSVAVLLLLRDRYLRGSAR